MALKLRLKRIGKKNLPFYRLVVVDSRWRRDGKSIANLGWYDPVKNPAQCSIKHEDVYKWLENGVQVSETVRSLLKQQGIWDRFITGEYKTNPEPIAQENTPVKQQATPTASENRIQAAPKPKPVEEPPQPAAAPAEEPKEETPAENSEEPKQETAETAAEESKE